MLIDVVHVEPLDGYNLRLTFEDGVCGVVAIDSVVEFTGVFAPLNDVTYFRQVYVNSEIGTICWPNDADIDPDVLYSIVTGEPLPSPYQLPSS